MRGNLEICVVDGMRCEENLFLLKLKEIIFDIYWEEINMRGIVFVCIWVVVDIIVLWMGEIEDLKNIKVKKYIGV